MEKTPDYLEAFIKQTEAKIKELLDPQFSRYEVVQVSVQVGKDQIGLGITLVDKNLLQKSRQKSGIVGARGPLGPPQGQA